MTFTKLNYCQYLLSSQTKFTLTYLAEHLQQFSHDAINCYLGSEKITPRLLWENVKPLICLDAAGYLIFDDTVLDKRFSESIELVRRQYSAACRRKEYSSRRTALATSIESFVALG